MSICKIYRFSTFDSCLAALTALSSDFFESDKTTLSSFWPRTNEAAMAN